MVKVVVLKLALILSCVGKMLLFNGKVNYYYYYYIGPIEYINILNLKFVLLSKNDSQKCAAKLEKTSTLQPDCREERKLKYTFQKKIMFFKKATVKLKNSI